jgi:hypothetical protein
MAAQDPVVVYNHHQQLLLCKSLMQQLGRHGVVLTADSMAWASALEAADSQAQELQQLQQKERELLRALDELMNVPGGRLLPSVQDIFVKSCPRRLA